MKRAFLASFVNRQIGCIGAIACHNSGETEEVVELTQNDNFLLNLFVSFLLCAAASLLPPPGYCVCVDFDVGRL